MTNYYKLILDGKETDLITSGKDEEDAYEYMASHWPLSYLCSVPARSRCTFKWWGTILEFE